MEPESLAKKRILLVDDEPSVVKMVAKRLEVAGYEVMVALDGQQGLEQAKAQRPDLVILDLMLPRLNGYEVCSMLKQDQQYQSIPVLILSARALKDEEKMGLACGADAYLHKPFQSQELLDRVRTLLENPPKVRSTESSAG
jgi:DNA-binding response OmpR family regulator